MSRSKFPQKKMVKQQTLKIYLQQADWIHVINIKKHKLSFQIPNPDFNYQLTVLNFLLLIHYSRFLIQIIYQPIYTPNLLIPWFPFIISNSQFSYIISHSAIFIPKFSFYNFHSEIFIPDFWSPISDPRFLTYNFHSRFSW